MPTHAGGLRILQSTSPPGSALFAVGRGGVVAPARVRTFNQEKEMNKLLSVIVAAMFAAVSASAFAASHAGAQMKDEKGKKEMKKGDDKKKSEGKKGEQKKKGEGKKSKDEMKK